MARCRQSSNLSRGRGLRADNSAWPRQPVEWHGWIVCLDTIGARHGRVRQITSPASEKGNRPVAARGPTLVLATSTNACNWKVSAGTTKSAITAPRSPRTGRDQSATSGEHIEVAGVDGRLDGSDSRTETMSLDGRRGRGLAMRRNGTSTSAASGDCSRLGDPNLGLIMRTV